MRSLSSPDSKIVQLHHRLKTLEMKMAKSEAMSIYEQAVINAAQEWAEEKDVDRNFYIVKNKLFNACADLKAKQKEEESDIT